MAERQDPDLVDRVLDYRVRKRAVEVYRQGKQGRETLKDQPVLLELLVELFRAQLGDVPGIGWDAVIGQRMDAMGGTDEDEDEE